MTPLHFAGRLLGAMLILAATLPPNSAMAAVPLLGGTEQAEPITVPADLEPAQIGDFVAPLTDVESRKLLIETLEHDAQTRRAASEGRSTGLLRSVEEGSARLSEERRAMLQSLSDAPAHLESAFRNLTGGDGFPAFIKGLAVFALMVISALAAERAIGYKIDPIRKRLTDSGESRIRGKLGALGMRLVLDGSSVFVFAFVGWSVSFLFFGRFDPMRVFAIAYFATITVTRIAWITSRSVFAPAASGLRLMDLPGTWANRLHRWTVLLVGVATFGFFTCALLKILGLDAHLHAFLLIAVDGVITALLVTMVWRSKGAVAEWLSGSSATHGTVQTSPESGPDTGIAMEPGHSGVQLGSEGEAAANAAEWSAESRPVRQAISQIWHLLATGYLLILWWMYSRDVMLGAIEASGAALLSLMILFAIPVADALLRALLEPEEGIPTTASQRLGARYGRPIRTAARIGLGLWVLLNLAEAAGLAVFGAMATPLGERINEALLDVAAALVIAYVIWELVKTAIDRNMPNDEAAGAQIGEEGSSGKATRAATLLPLLRSFVLVVLVVMVTLIVLSSLGVNIGPLLAGAGVIGLAIGFGSQKLVQDIVAGIFFLVDDAFRVGEYIEAGGMKGTVESISIRSMRLRHHLGAVQTLPYGNIDSVKNHSRDWATMKLEIRLPYDVDMEKVRKTIKKTGQAMLENPEYGHHFLQPLKSQGVFRVEDSALIVRMKFTTVPNEQWVIRREAYRLVKEALAAQGIEFAHRQVFVNVPGGDHGEPLDLPKAAAAATAAIQAAEEQKTVSATAPAMDDR